MDNFVSGSGVGILLVFFLLLAALGVTTVVVPELQNDSSDLTPDGGVSEAP